MSIDEVVKEICILLIKSGFALIIIMILQALIFKVLVDYEIQNKLKQEQNKKFKNEKGNLE